LDKAMLRVVADLDHLVDIVAVGKSFGHARAWMGEAGFARRGRDCESGGRTGVI